MDAMQRLVVMSAPEMDQTLNRLAEEIIRRQSDLSRQVLVGIRTGGAFLAQRLGATRLQLLDVYRDLMPVRTDEGGQA